MVSGVPWGTAGGEVSDTNWGSPGSLSIMGTGDPEVTGVHKVFREYREEDLRLTCECMHAQLLQLCPTLFDPVNLPDSSVHGILQARILE